MSDDIVLVTGGFDPLHSGHIEYIKSAAQRGRVIVGLNSDEWLVRKKKRAFLPFSERKTILENLKQVMLVIGFNDSDNTACDAIAVVKKMFPRSKIIFANGGDRTNTNTPEAERYKGDLNVLFEYGVGGENKMNSSSWILEEWKAPKTERSWGCYRVVNEYGKEVKLKELNVNPGKKLSMQKHSDRNEFWFVAEGEAMLHTYNDKGLLQRTIHNKFDIVEIEKGQWHQLCNGSNEPLKIIEIQYGIRCDEEDIVRLNME